MSNQEQEIEIISLPYEEGTYWRKGAKFGPESILRKFKDLREYSIGNDLVIKSDNIHYNNDVYLSPYNRDQAFSQIKTSVLEALKGGRIPILLGGDHSITYSIVKAFAEFYGKGNFGIIQFDSHTDTFDEVDGFNYHHGATFRNIIEDGLVKEENVFQFGIRGQVREDSISFLYSEKRTTVTIEKLVENRFEISKFIKNRNIPYYVSFDIDFVDPAFAPGTGTPVPGGCSSFETLNIIRNLNFIKIIGFDLVEVAPQYDSSEITSLLAANILHEIISSSFSAK